MARNIKQSTEIGNNGNADQGICIGSFSLSTSDWGTLLEKKLVQLPYPELVVAFRKAAEVIQSGIGTGEVQRLVKLARPKRIQPEDLAENCSEESLYSRLLTEQALEDPDPQLFERQGPLLAQTVIGRLWVLSELLVPTGKRVPTIKVVRAITEVCLLAEKAQHAFYTEERTRLWRKFSRSQKSIPSVKAKNSGAKSSGNAFLDSVLRWLKKNGHRFSSPTDAATAFLESNLQPVSPMFLQWLMQRCELESESCVPRKAHSGSPRSRKNVRGMKCH